MIKKYKKVFLTAFALLCFLNVDINSKAADVYTKTYNKFVNESWYINNGSPCTSSDESIVSLTDRKLLLLKTDNELTCKKVGSAVVSCKADFWHFSKDAQYTVNCNAKTESTGASGGDDALEMKKPSCRKSTETQVYHWFEAGEKIPSVYSGYVFGVSSKEQCDAYNTTCRKCSDGVYRFFTTQSAAINYDNGSCHNATAGHPDVGEVSGIEDQATCESYNTSTTPTHPPIVRPTDTTPTTTYPEDNNRVGISDYVEKEVTLDPPSRPTNTVTGTCEDYIVTEEGSEPIGPNLPSAKGNYLYYSAKTNCTDNQGQEFVAFCVDPAQWGPKPSANYSIDSYIDPNDGDFSKGVVYVYKKFLENRNTLASRCAAENAIRYLEYDSTVGGGIAPRTLGNFSADALAYQRAVAAGAPASSESCSTQGWKWYTEAKEAIAANDPTIAAGYGTANVEIVPDNDYTQDDSGNVSGHLLVQTPSGERVEGNITITCPNGVTCTDEGNGRIAISGTLSCGNNTLTAAVADSGNDSEIKSVLLVVNKSGLQRFVLFQTGGSVSVGASFEFDGVKDCSECKTNVDFECAPEGSYNNPIILKEGTMNGEGDTEWAACVYNNSDEKGNTFNALKNDYCVVSCTEEWDFRLPGNIQTVSGRNFSFSAQIGAKRTCREVGDYSGGGVITPINYRRSDGKVSSPAQGYTSFAEDYYYWANIMVDSYNKYLYEKAVAESIEKYVKENAPDGHYTPSGTSYSDERCRGASDEKPIKWEHDKDEPGKSNGYYAHSAALGERYVSKLFTTKYIFQVNSPNHIISRATTAADYGFTLSPNDVTTPASSEGYTAKGVTNPNYNPHDASSSPTEDIECSKTAYETYEDPDNIDYKSTIQQHKDAATSAYGKYQEALGKVQSALKMYQECTDWVNKYEFDPEIRFTYQEESYMDLLLQHQNKNYLINRKEIETPREQNLVLYDIEIAVGEPGGNLEGLTGSANGGSEGWSSPLDGGLVCTGGKGRTSSYDAQPHRGIDLRASYVSVKAAKSGTVTAAQNHSSWGNYVKIDHGDGTTSLYAHLSQISVSKGASVSQGQVIGISGATGNVSGPHLHLEITVNGALVDPAPYYGLTCPDGSSDSITPTSGNANIVNEVQTYGETYQLLIDSGGYVAQIQQETAREATYGVSEVEYKAEETEYRSGVYFYTINPSGRVTTDKNAEGAVPLGYVYPISLNTPQGDYPYYLNFGYVGMYNDSNRLGRIMGAAESSVLSGEAADYVCKYNVCDPTMQDCPPQMCDEVTDGNGNTHYYDKEGNETDKDTHDQQCASRDKVCTRERDENGNDVFCDANGECSQDPSSYLKSCAKDCAGYTLVGYESYTGAEVESSGRLQFLPKIVSLNNLFSAGNQSAKAINWQNAKAQAARTEIESNGEKIFASSQYEFNLSPSAMASIRNYNKTQEDNDKGYADFDLECDDHGSNCVSNFLNNLSSRGVDVVKRDTSFTPDSKGYSYK